MTTSPLAPRVHNLERQVVEEPTIDVFELAEMMRAHAGPDFDAIVDRIWSARTTLDETFTDLMRGDGVPDMLTLEPEALADRIRAACHDRATQVLDPLGYSSARRVSDTMRDQLVTAAQAALRPAADTVTLSLRRDFDKAAKNIKTAAAAGITEHTVPAELLESGTPQQIQAFRSLPDAVRRLEGVAHLRNAMQTTLRYGQQDQALSYVTGITSTLSLRGAVNAYPDPVTWAQYDAPTLGSSHVRVRGQRLGGRWLALVVAGYTLRLNTAAEVDAVHAAAYDQTAA